MRCPPIRKLDWLLAALEVACDVYPAIDVRVQRSVLSELADGIAREGLERLSPRRQAEELSKYLYDIHGFRGNAKDYDDPRNSLINDVLERRKGIPISLALIYTEVARAASVMTHGVAFPGHFLVKIIDPIRPGDVDRSVFIDPYDGGRVLEPVDLSLLAERTTGSPEVEPHWLARPSVATIVTRMLNNLRASYARRGDYSRLLIILHRLCELNPSSAPMVRDRGLTAARLGAVRSAIADLEQYLDLSPHASDAQEIQTLIDDLLARIHRGSLRHALN